MGYWLDRLKQAEKNLGIADGGNFPPLEDTGKTREPGDSIERPAAKAKVDALKSKLWEQKERILNEVSDRLEPLYPRGLYDWLYVHDRDLYTRINAIEDRLNESFCNGGPVDEFKATLRRYWDAHMRAIRLFRQSGQPEAPPEAREARIAEREATHV